MKKYCFAALFCLLLPSRAGAFSVEHDFYVQLGPFNAAATRFTYALDSDAYRVNSVVRTAGIFDSLYPFRADYATAGKINGRDLLTASYSYRSKSRFNRRAKELIYDDKGRPLYRLSRKNDREKKVEIEPDVALGGTTDLQTVFAELARQYNQVRFCDARMQVFDGKRRFDVIFKDEGREQIPAAERMPFAGEAAKCSMYIDKLGAKGDDLLWELTQDRPIYFWIMEDPETGKPFIARILVESTPLGRLEVYTSALKIKT